VNLCALSVLLIKFVPTLVLAVLTIAYKNMINYKTLDVEYDAIIIFDMLSIEEREKDNISEKIDNLIKRNKYTSELFNLTNKTELFQKFSEVLQKVKQGKKYMFHFVAHGNTQGIGFKHLNEFVPWDCLQQILTDININSNNTIVLNMTSCYGVHGVKTVNPFSDDKPFFGLIGYNGKLNKSRSILLNERCYTSIINGFSINDIISDLVEYFSDDKMQGITSQGFSELSKGN